MLKLKRTLNYIVFALLLFSAMHGVGQDTRRKGVPIQSPTPTPTPTPPPAVTTGFGGRPSSSRLALLADVCALITADEVEKIMSVSNNRALVSVSMPRWIQEQYKAADFSSVSCDYDLKYVNALYPEEREPAFPQGAYLDSAGFSIRFNDKYALEGRLIIDPKDKQTIELVKGLGDEALFLVDTEQREKDYGIAGRKPFTNFLNRDSLHVLKGDLVVQFSVWKRVGDYRGKMLDVARKVIGRLP